MNGKMSLSDKENSENAKTQEIFATRHLSGKITAVILSAGLSQRMRKFKPFLNYNGKSFLQNIIEKLSKICNEIIIVTGYNSKLIEEHIAYLEKHLQKKIRLVYNSSYERGMFTSLKIGVKRCDANWLLYHFVDQPNLPQNFYTEFVEQVSPEYDWIQPVFENRKGHPILFNKNVMKIIADSDDKSTLRDIITEKSINKKYWKCNYPEVLSDFDKPDDLIKLIRS